MMTDLLGLSISTGMMAKLPTQAAALLEGPTQEILDAVRNAPAVHVDKTGREAGKKAWLWVSVGAAATAFVIHPKRSRDGLGALLGDQPKPNRVVISDRFSIYSRAPRTQHEVGCMVQPDIFRGPAGGGP